jgi:hypothetical protein
MMEMKVSPTGEKKKATKTSSLQGRRNPLRKITVPLNLLVMTLILSESHPEKLQFTM